MTNRNIRINIDPFGAKAGAAKLTKSLHSTRAAGEKAGTDACLSLQRLSEEMALMSSCIKAATFFRKP
jgi:hypothetical protein